MHMQKGFLFVTGFPLCLEHAQHLPALTGPQKLTSHGLYSILIMLIPMGSWLEACLPY